MGINPQLLEILCCPESHQPLSEVGADFLLKLNELVSTGSLKNSEGVVVEGPLDGALLREDRLVLYPVRQGIPVLLVDERIPVPSQLQLS